MKKFNVIEDNGGGLSLVVFAEDGETIEYIHSGYEFDPGQLSGDLENLKNGDDPAKDWEGNLLEDDEAVSAMEAPEDLESWFPQDQKGPGWEVVSDNDGIYPESMGTAAKIEFKIEE